MKLSMRLFVVEGSFSPAGSWETETMRTLCSRVIALVFRCGL